MLCVQHRRKSMSENNEKGSGNLSCAQVFFIVVVLAAVVWFFFPDSHSGSGSGSTETKRVETPMPPPPPYTEQDAMKDLSWYEERISEYLKMNTMDYPTARKAMNEINGMYAV